MAIRVAINGFGRIGKSILRIYLEEDRDVEIVAINSTSGPEPHAHLLKYDSVYGIIPEDVKVEGNKMIVGEEEIIFTAERNPEDLPWDELDIDVVVEATGVFRKKADAEKHIKAGAKKVIITAPAQEPDITIVMGVNHEDYDPEKHHVISAASCTTTCLAPVAKVINDEFGINNGLLTTIHAYTADQMLIDKPHRDLRRARAAALSIVPTTTGAAKAISLIIPELEGKMNGISLRVPVPTVSVIDLVANIDKKTTAEEVNNVHRSAANDKYKGVLDYTEEPLVSSDFIKNPYSSIVDGLSTMVIDDDVVKVLAWYDNEYGYACRVMDLITYSITG